MDNSFVENIKNIALAATRFEIELNVVFALICLNIAMTKTHISIRYGKNENL